MGQKYKELSVVGVVVGGGGLVKYSLARGNTSLTHLSNQEMFVVTKDCALVFFGVKT